MSRRAFIAAAVAWAGAAAAQQPVLSPVLTIDSDRLFRGRIFGPRVGADIEARAADAAPAHPRLAREPQTEEPDLTRPSSSL